jgi:hypothetical protein
MTIDQARIHNEMRRQAGLSSAPDDRPEDRVRNAEHLAVERLRADQTLTPKARTARLAAIRRDTLAKLSAAQEHEGQRRAEDLAKARRTAFGVAGSSDDPATMAAHRSALAQADEITDPAIAASRLQRAEGFGDETMARAIAHRSMTMGWSGVLESYASTRPEAAEAIEELGSGESMPTGAADLFRYVVSALPELTSKINRAPANARQLEVLANGGDVEGFGS